MSSFGATDLSIQENHRKCLNAKPQAPILENQWINESIMFRRYCDDGNPNSLSVGHFFPPLMQRDFLSWIVKWPAKQTSSWANINPERWVVSKSPKWVPLKPHCFILYYIKRPLSYTLFQLGKSWVYTTLNESCFAMFRGSSLKHSTYASQPMPFVARNPPPTVGCVKPLYFCKTVPGWMACVASTFQTSRVFFNQWLGHFL